MKRVGKTLAFFALMMSAAFTQTAKPKPPFEFRGVRLNAPLDENDLPEVEKVRAQCGCDIKITDGKITSIVFQFPIDDWVAYQKAFEKKYGPPTLSGYLNESWFRDKTKNSAAESILLECDPACFISMGVDVTEPANI